MADPVDIPKDPENSKKPLSAVPSMPSDSLQIPVNKITPNRDSYWFAHSGSEEVPPAISRNSSKTPDGKDSQSQKEREERIKLFREQQEEERVKKMKELEQAFVLSRKYREQQEEERRRKIEEARIKENERRQQVEERKRQIWEAEQERKEAILRRNLEREARIEARRNAQRNSLSFAFGSSTPRTFDLDLAALGRSSAVGCPLMSAVSGRRSEERDFGSKRATSACSLDRKPGDDCMSWSMISLSSSSRGRRRTDLTPVAPRERSTTPHTVPRGNPSLRAVSMTRLDQLAQPRRRYYDTTRDTSSTAIVTPTGHHTVSPSMSKSMCNLNLPNTHYQLSQKLSRAPSSKSGSHSMSRSMLQLPGSTPKFGQTNCIQAVTSPTSPPAYDNPLAKLRSAQSMTHLAVAPRLTRATRLRADALASARQNGRTTSMMNLSKGENQVSGRLLLSAKNTSRSPSRPQSSMSGRSEISITSSQTSAVNLRPKPAPRKPRPVSIAGTTVERTTWNSNDVQNRKPRPYERSVFVPKPPRAKSSDPENPVKNLSVVKKPVPPPKSAQVLAKARSHPVPTKDNLRKVVKVPPEPKVGISNNCANVDAKNITLNQNETEGVKPSPPPEEPALSKPKIIAVEEYKREEEVTASSEADSVTSSVSQSQDDASREISKSDTQDEMTKSPLQLENMPEQVNLKENSYGGDSTVVKPRIISEEEAKAALAEKRRLAREQAEREAELERQRQEELQRQEEERRKQEELEQRRQEEEQIRLAKLHRKLEEEKLRKAIEEQKQREQEEKERQEEEARQKAEKEEQEKKAREEAERQRIELEERLRKEEQERAERKRRVEQIMSRTRGKGIQQTNNSPHNKEVFSSADNNMQTITGTTQEITNSATQPTNVNNFDVILNNNNHSLAESSTEMIVNTSAKNNSVISDNVETNNISNLNMQSQPSDNAELFDLDALVHNVKNGFHSENTEQTFIRPNTVNNVPKRTSNKDSAYATQTNGYSSHEDTSLMSSPEERSEKTDSSEGVLLDLQSTQSVANHFSKGQVEINQLIDIGSEGMTTNSHNDNYVIDVVNSNIVSSSNPFLTFEDNLPKKQENTFTDLMS